MVERLVDKVYEIVSGEFLELRLQEYRYWDKFIDHLKEIGKQYDFREEAFNYYDMNTFGFPHDSEEAEKHTKHLRKKVDQYGIRLFRVNSKMFKEIQEKIKKDPNIVAMEKVTQRLYETNLEGLVGRKNAKSYHKVGERIFITVHKPELIQEAPQRHHVQEISVEEYNAYVEANQ